MDPMLAVPLAFLVLAAGYHAVRWYLSDVQDARRKLAALPRTSAGATTAPEGYVKVIGVVERPKETVRSALSDRECVYSRLLVEEFRSEGRAGKWVTRADEVVWSDFTLRDGEHRCDVRWGPAVVVGEFDIEQNAGTFRDPTPRMLEVLERNHLEPENWFGMNRKYRFRELVLVADETLAVAGLARWERDASSEAANYREAPKRMVLVPPEGAPLLVSNEPAATAG